MSREGKNINPFVKLFRRVIEYVKSDDILINGSDNLYPNRIEQVLENSSSGALAVRAMVDFITGKGVKDDVIINTATKQLKSEFVEEAAKQMAIHYGVFVHVSYKIDENGYLVPFNPVVIPSKDCRISKSDDVGNKGFV